MDLVELWRETVFYMASMWASFAASLASGSAVGILLAQALSTLVPVLLIFWVWRMFTRRRRKVSSKTLQLLKQVRQGLAPKGAEYANLNGKIAEVVILDVELLYARGEITLEEKDYIYEKIAKAIGSDELKAFAAASKREQIKKRKDSYKALNLPDITAKSKTAFAWATGRIRKR